MGLSLYQRLDGLVCEILALEKGKAAAEEAIYKYVQNINSCTYRERCPTPNIWNDECTCGIEALRRIKNAAHDINNDI